jgi:hypothetical protein
MALTHQLVYPVSATSATGLLGGQTILSRGFRNAIYQLVTSGSANMTIKFVYSSQEAKPDFTSAQSATNLWDYVQSVNLSDGTPIDGATGISWTGTDGVKTIEINTNQSGMIWVGAVITARAAGTVSGNMTLSTNA